jgi:CBS domain-containing protein
MRIKEVMNEDIEVIDSAKTVKEAAQMMRDGDYGAIPVVKDEKMVGMITDRDIVVRVIAEDKSVDVTTVEECMTKGIEYCYANDELEDLVKKMSSKRLRRIPVVNEDKKLVGIVSLKEIVSCGKNDATVAQDVLSGITH